MSFGRVNVCATPKELHHPPIIGGALAESNT